MRLVSYLAKLTAMFKWWHQLQQHFCLFCLAPATKKIPICDKCIEVLPHSESYCPQCGSPLTPPSSCLTCTTESALISRFWFPFWYVEPIDTLIKALKFANQLYLARLLGELLADYLLSVNFKLADIDVIMPVPLGAKRLAQRGYNQAGEIAKVVARRLNLPLDLTYLERHVDTTAQATLNVKRRKRNLSHAFRVAVSTAPYHSVALIDDVFTTQATLNACASVLQAAKVRYIEAWCVAHARFN